MKPKGKRKRDENAFHESDIDPMGLIDGEDVDNEETAASSRKRMKVVHNYFGFVYSIEKKIFF